MRWERVASARMAQAFPVRVVVVEVVVEERRERGEVEWSGARRFFFFLKKGEAKLAISRPLLSPHSPPSIPIHSLYLARNNHSKSAHTKTNEPATAEMNGLSAMMVPISTLDRPRSDR